MLSVALFSGYDYQRLPSHKGNGFKCVASSCKVKGMVAMGVCPANGSPVSVTSSVTDVPERAPVFTNRAVTRATHCAEAEIGSEQEGWEDCGILSVLGQSTFYQVLVRKNLWVSQFFKLLCRPNSRTRC